MLYSVLIFLFVLVCIMLVGIILLQSSKTGGMGGAIGGQSAMNEAFGGEGADKLLVRITGGLAFTFMFLAIMISLYPISNNTDIDNPVIARNKGKQVGLTIPEPLEIENLNQDDSKSDE